MTTRTGEQAAATRPAGSDAGAPASWLNGRRRALSGAARRRWSVPAGFVLWEVGGQVAGVRWFPPLSEVLVTAVALWRSGELPRQLLVSFRGLAIGYLVAVVLGLVLGVLMARYRKLSYALTEYVNALLVTPTIIFAPIFLSIFGLADTTRVLIIVMASLFVVVVNTQKAFSSTDHSLVEMARSYGATERQVLRKVVVPAAMPLTLAGLRLALGRGALGMINGEMVIVVVGLGGLIMRYGGRFDAASVLAILLVVVSISLLLLSAVRWLDTRLTRWSD